MANIITNILELDGTITEIQEIIEFLQEDCEDDEVLNLDNIIYYDENNDTERIRYRRFNFCWEYAFESYFDEDRQEFVFNTYGGGVLNIIIKLGAIFPYVTVHYLYFDYSDPKNSGQFTIHGKYFREEPVDYDYTCDDERIVNAWEEFYREQSLKDFGDIKDLGYEKVIEPLF
ncbi:MAG: hypothetical protein J1E16_00575 [Muribaculaceae bacterium]|nr:hypothetical protein [Muribaculaceae bacterium]